MNKLIKYSFRIFSLTIIGFTVFEYGSYKYPLYFSIILCLVPWIVYELFFTEHANTKKTAGIIFESVSMLSAVILFDPFLFSGFLIILFFQIFTFYQLKTGVLINFGLILFLAAAVFITHVSPEVLVLIIPFTLLSYLLFRSVQESEAELNAEIDALQAQIDGKNKLLSTLAHELRTPLAVIKTSSEILLEERPGEINPTQRRFLKAVQDNTLRMVRFADSILASIKVEYAWFRMKKREKDIRPVIKKVCGDLEPFIQSRNQTLKYNYPSLLSKTIIDDNWIQQVLINLIHNASKHVGDGGRIVISVNENEQCVVVSVSDDGSGIVNNDKPKIFSEFYQGKDNQEISEENFDGVGLGLSIVKNVIEKHGGNVYMGSVSGVGTTLSFTLPKVGE